MAAIDPASEKKLALVHPILAERTRATVHDLIGRGHDARVISGLRTYAEQNAEFAKGRFGNAGPRVTNARGGQSNHNFGLACDIGIFDAHGKYLQESPAYNLIQAAAHAAGLESGADWRHINDRPHVQLKTDLIVNGSPTEKCRTLFNTGGLPAVFAHVTAGLGATPAPAPAPAPATDNVHVVVSGDTLSGLAKKFGTTVDALEKLNALASDVLQIGQKIRVK